MVDRFDIAGIIWKTFCMGTAVVKFLVDASEPTYTEVADFDDRRCTEIVDIWRNPTTVIPYGNTSVSMFHKMQKKPDEAYSSQR
jgi:hypothetical protein